MNPCCSKKAPATIVLKPMILGHSFLKTKTLKRNPCFLDLTSLKLFSITTKPIKNLADDIK